MATQTTNELKELTDSEKLAFELVNKCKFEELAELVKEKKIRVNCLDESGMNLLDQACFRGNERIAEFLLENGANVDNRAHSQGYTCLMFAALAGNADLCRRLLDAGARAHAVNVIGKTASELAAFVGQHECVSVISSYISLDEVERIVHPNGTESSVQYPPQMIEFIHRLTRTNEIHPVRLALNVMGEAVLLKHRKTILNTVDALFERQLRSKEPNEIQSMKLWLILFTLRELLKFVDLRLKSAGESAENVGDNEAATAIRIFVKNLIKVSSGDVLRPVEERFLRTAAFAFPYKQSMVYKGIAEALNRIELGRPPSAYIVICQNLFGFRFVQTSTFCIVCGVPSASKRCRTCKRPYCSAECQKLDWPFHKIVCSEWAKNCADESEEQNIQTIELKK